MDKWIGRLSGVGGVVAGGAIVLSVLFIFTEIVLRLAFNLSMLIAQEFSGYLLVLFTFTSLAIVFKKGRHIRITVISSHFPQKCQKLLHLLACCLALLLIIYMIYWSSSMAFGCFQTKRTVEAVSEVYVFIPMSFVPLGLSLFALQLIASIAERVKEIKVERL